MEIKKRSEQNQDQSNSEIKKQDSSNSKSQVNQNQKMDIPQRPGSSITIGPEGPYSEDSLIGTPAPDSDAR